MPYAPGVTNVSGQLFAQGMSQGIGRGLSALVDGLAQHKANTEEADQQQQLSKALTPYIVKDPEARAQFGEDLVKAPTMGLSKLKAFNAGMSAYLMQKATAAKAQQASDLNAALLKNYANQDALAQQQMEGMNALKGFAVDMADGRPENIAYALAQNPGATTAPQFDNSLSALAKFAPQAGGPNQVDIIDLPGGRKGASVRGSKELKVFEDFGTAPEFSEDLKYIKGPRGWQRIREGSGAVTPAEVFRDLSRQRIDLMKTLNNWDAKAPEYAQTKQDIADLDASMKELQQPETGAPSAETQPPNEAAPVTSDIAKDFLRKARGNKVKARKLAKDAGYSW